MTEKELLQSVDKNIAVISKYFNISPMEIMDGDYHYYIHQYNLAVKDEYDAIEEETPPPKIQKTDSLFAAFGATDVQ